jgi:hypothetical protein
MSEKDLAALEAAIALMRDAGRTHIPIRLEVVEGIIARERRRLGLPVKRGEVAAA